MFLDKRANVVSLTNGTETTGHIKKRRKMNLYTDLTLFTKIISKQITDLKVKHKTIKLQ